MRELTIDELLLMMQIKKKFYKFFLRFALSLCIMMFIIGLLGFTNGFFVATENAFWIKSTTELPWGALGCIAVDHEGNIYLASYFYYRIQKYSKDGKFISGWPAKDNNPRIRINEKNQLESANDNQGHWGDRPDTLSVYDSDGNLLSDTVSDGCYVKFGTQRSCKDINGNTYGLKNKFWNPYIVKMLPNTKTEIIHMPWYLWLFMGPFPAWLFLAIGLVGGWKAVDKM